jgi:hypothetical protein
MVGQLGTGEDTMAAGQLGRYAWCRNLGCASRCPRESGTVYIGLGTLVFVLVVLGIVYLVRRA